MQEMWVWSVGQEDPLEKKIATHSSFLAWEITWTEEPDGLQSMGLQRVGLDSGTEDAQQGPQIYWVKILSFSRFPGDLYTQSRLPSPTSGQPRPGACAGTGDVATFGCMRRAVPRMYSLCAEDSCKAWFAVWHSCFMCYIIFPCAALMVIPSPFYFKEKQHWITAWWGWGNKLWKPICWWEKLVTSRKNWISEQNIK